MSESIPQQITEAMKVHDAWYEEAKTISSPEALAAFVTKLGSAYAHDYGTICHAVTAAAIAAAHAVDRGPSGGITGFQASLVALGFYGKMLSVDGPFRVVRYQNMLFNQYEEYFTKELMEIRQDTMGWLKAEAKKRLEENPDVRPDLIEHWKNLSEGIPPFGYTVKD